MNATEYMKHWENNKVWTHLKWAKHQKRFETIARYLKGPTFIDVGCAYGHSTYWLRTFKPGLWSGLDFDEGAIKRANKLFKKHDLFFYYASDFNLIDVCCRFDSVVCSEVMEHVGDDRALVAGLLAITKKRLVLTTPDRKVSDPGHLRIYNRPMIEALFNDTDHEIINEPPFFYIVVRK